MNRVYLTFLLTVFFMLFSCDNKVKVDTLKDSDLIFDNSSVDDRSPQYIIYCGSTKLHYCKFKLLVEGMVMEAHYMVEYDKKGTLIERQKKALNRLFNKPFFSRDNNVFCLPYNSVSVTTMGTTSLAQEGTTTLAHDLAYSKFVLSSEVIYLNKPFKEFTETFKRKNLRVGFSAAPVSVLDAAVANRYNDKTSALIDIEDSAISLYLMSHNKVSIIKLSVSYDQIFEDISKKFNVSVSEASDLYLQKGFIGLGPAYEPPEDPEAEKLSNILRVYHLAIAEEIRGHFKKFEEQGFKIERLLLTGSRCVAAFTETVFKNQLNVEVEYANFFRGIRLGAHYVGEKRQELAANAHEMGCLIGAALEVYAGETNQLKNPNIK